jgi:hypothetical protein
LTQYQKRFIELYNQSKLSPAPYRKNKTVTIYFLFVCQFRPCTPRPSSSISCTTRWTTRRCT